MTPALLGIKKAVVDYYAIQFHLKQLNPFLCKSLVVNKLSPEKTYASCQIGDHFVDHVFTALCILNIDILNIKKREVELWPN